MKSNKRIGYGNNLRILVFSPQRVVPMIAARSSSITPICNNFPKMKVERGVTAISETYGTFHLHRIRYHTQNQQWMNRVPSQALF